MKVIRIEHPEDGKGFFHSHKNGQDVFISTRRCFSHSDYYTISHRHGNSDKFPTYLNDWELIEKFEDEGGNSYADLENYNFAYNSLEQLESGFTREEIKECIESLGFRVLMYTLEKDYYASEYQVIFIKESAVNVEDISSLFL